MTSFSQRQEYSLRMVIAEIFRASMRNPRERDRVFKRAGVETMPVIIPALENTLASHISRAAKRHLDAGEKTVLVPVGNIPTEGRPLSVTILALSNEELETFWQLDLDDMPPTTEMREVVEVLDPDKKWDLSELDADLLAGLH